MNENMAHKSPSLILWFDEISNTDVSLVGGKNASLGEMFQKLRSSGVPVPNGFAVTAESYRLFLEHNKLRDKIQTTLRGLNTNDTKNLAQKGEKIRSAMLNGEFPEELEQAIVGAYLKLGGKRKKPGADVAIRSSATAEDLPDASFAGQQDTYLNIRGIDNVLDAVRRAFASLFTDRAISYREDKGFSHMKVALSVGVQLMVRSDKASSGVMFTLDTESGFKDVVLINSIYGLGENIVQGAVRPDEFIVFKPTLAKGKYAILSKRMGTKSMRMVYDTKKPVKNIPVKRSEQMKFSITDKEITQLAKWAVLIENHYKKPMDIEWAKDGITGKLFIVQARPETVRSGEDSQILREYSLKNKPRVTLATGVSVGKKIGQGKARVIMDSSDMHTFKKGEVLITDMTTPDWEPIMKMASAIVTDFGGRTAHAAIVSRELGIPAIVGTRDASEKIKTGSKITVDCSQGDIGKIYEGIIPFDVKETNISKIPKLSSKIMLNVGEPSRAFSFSKIPNDGVGLARLEFIINEHIKAHPLALLNVKKLKNAKTKKQIEKIITEKGYSNGKEMFISELTEGIARIAAAFYPKDVIVRLSDFKTNEYRSLIGGEEFEPEESNPMIGWRGASRYYDPTFRPAFDMECMAFKKVRRDMGLVNVKIMVPFVRTIEEAKNVIGIMKKNGLVQGKNDLQIYMMVEVPSNVVLADQFAKIFDGFSIGSNDLTQLTLGVDRDSEIVSHVYDEQNESVKSLIKYAIDIAKKHKIKIGICGQAPSDYPEFAKFLLKENIDSISLTPDTALSTRLKLAKR